MTVFVISKNGERLMPTVRCGRVRHLLKQGKVKIVKHNPFTIQLTYKSTNYTQPIEFCEDTGDHHVGISIKSKKREFVSEEYLPLADEKMRHDDCRKLRRTRKNRLRYRAKRFNNRKRDDGWLTPSIIHKKDVNLDAYKKYVAVCPIVSATFEVGQFDTIKLHAIENGTAVPEGKDYQQGPRYTLATLREAVFFRDGYKCVFCGRSVKDGAILHVHHALFWKGRHGNSVSELATCCEKCHTSKNHQKDGKLWGYKPKDFTNMAGAATMNILRWRILNGAKAIDPDVKVCATYGSDTKARRLFYGIKKSHANDAYVMGDFLPSIRATFVCWQKVRRNNRILEKFYDAKYIDARDGSKQAGKTLFSGRAKRNKNLSGENLHQYRKQKVSKGRRNIRRNHYVIKPGDIVLYQNKKMQATGCQNNGTYVAFGSIHKPVKLSDILIVKHSSVYKQMVEKDA